MTGWPVARIAGIEIRLHLTWIPVLVFLTAAVAMDVAGSTDALADPDVWVVGLASALGFLGSVLAHELAHALMGRRRGVEVSSITLFFFGGSASIELESGDPHAERAIAVAGPAVSGLLGAGLVGLAWLLPGDDNEVAAVVRAVALVLGVLNLLLAGLNAIPAFPLDGGRVLRATVWARTGNERSGTRAAALVGRYAGWALSILGLVIALLGPGLDGVMLILSGWFLGNASRAVERRLAVEDLLRGMRVEEAMERDTPTVAPQLTVDTFGDEFKRDGGVSVAVVADNRLLGLIGISQLRRLGRRAWTTTRAGDLMVTPPVLPTLTPDEALWPAVEALRRSGLDGLPVVRDADLLGVLTRRAVLATIASRAKGLVDVP